MSVAEELKKLHDLKNEGVLTEQEFSDAKASVLRGQQAPNVEVSSPGQSSPATPAVAAPFTPAVIAPPPASATEPGKVAPEASKAPKTKLFYAYDLIWIVVGLLAPILLLIPVGIIISRSRRYKRFAESPATYRPVPTPAEIRPTGVIIGIAMIGAAAFIFFSYIPEHSVNPERLLAGLGQAVDGTLLSEQHANWLKLLAAALGLLGVLQLLTGARTKAWRVRPCPNCAIDVVARPAFIGEQCERCGGTF